MRSASRAPLGTKGCWLGRRSLALCAFLGEPTAPPGSEKVLALLTVRLPTARAKNPWCTARCFLELTVVSQFSGRPPYVVLPGKEQVSGGAQIGLVVLPNVLAYLRYRGA